MPSSFFSRSKKAAQPTEPSRDSATSASVRSTPPRTSSASSSSAARLFPRANPASPAQDLPSQQASPKNDHFSTAPKSPQKQGRNNSSYFARDKNSRSRAPFSRKNSRRRSSSSEAEHPLNLPPDELRRLSALSVRNMSASGGEQNGSSSSAQPVQDDSMETSPAPEAPPSSADAPGAFPTTNGVNGEHSSTEEEGPAPPPHGSSKDSSMQQSEAPKVDPEACKAAGNKFYKAGQYDKAIEEYTKAIEADPQSSTFLSNRTAAYMAAGNYRLALEDCKQADELEPKSVKILHRMAKIYTSLGRPQEALDTFDRIEPPASQKDKSPAVNMRNHIQQAQDSLESGTAGSMAIHAIEQAEKGLGSGVQPPRKWRLLRGEAYLKMGNVNSLGDAQNVAMSLLRADNADPEALVLRGRALYAQGENDKAIQHFRQAISYDPDFKSAVKYMRMVQKLDRMKEEGNTHFKAGRFKEAVDVYTNALEVDPGNKGTNSKILNNRAMCHSKLKQWDSAIEDCDKAIQLDPSYTKARKTRAKALGEGGNWEEAVRAYKSIAEQSPEEPGIAKEIRNAELELKKSQRKDYYKILGVDKDAGETEIKRAYKKLAVKHHPDKNIDDPEAENRFKDIQEAHETLVDPQKRERYDSGIDLMDPSDAFGGGMGGMGGGMGGMGGGVQIDPDILFNMMGGMGGGGGGGGRGGPGGFPGGFSFATGGPGGGRSRGGQQFPGGFSFG